ncbi:MAG: hypothetical protein KF799_09625 [Bdellovibrionales bacterium]|nr:hypothetical protein [Bdellovibrionales bacterium]
MFKSLIFFALFAAGVQSHAGTVSTEALARTFAVDVHPSAMINWTIGDSADYNMNGGIMSGTMHMFVRESNDQGFWLQQDLKLGFLGEHKVETLIDKNNGKVLEVLVDGQKQNVPDAGEQEVTDSRRENVTVPKGTFEAMWLKIHNKKDNSDSQAWLNPTIVPITGMLKSIQPSQMGEVTLELTDFKRN